MGGDCVDFEDLVISTVYNVGDSFYVANSDDSLSFNVHAKDFTYALEQQLLQDVQSGKWRKRRSFKRWRSIIFCSIHPSFHTLQKP